MFMWDELTPITLSASPTNQLKVNLSVRATTLCTIEILVKSSCWTSLNTGMITMRGKRSEGIVVSRCQGHSTHDAPSELKTRKFS